MTSSRNVFRILVALARRIVRRANLFGPNAGLPPGGLGSFVVEVSLVSLASVVLCTPLVHATEPIRVESVLLGLIEQADVPARDPGVIESIAVHEGDLVRKGDRVVQLDTAEIRLDVERAQLERNIALQEAKNEVEVRFARKSLEVAEAELQRALDSVKDYPKSVSETELDRLKLTVERTRLEIEQAEHVMTVAEMTAALKQNALQTAEAKLARQTICAPIDGMVVQLYRHCGEWVEPGQQVVRLLRMDRLRVEGFLAVSLLDEIAIGSPVELFMETDGEEAKAIPGKLVYVNPEVDPVNNQVRVWAEVENECMRLKPGMRGSMLIQPKPDATPASEPAGPEVPSGSDPAV